jgi:O-antigen/teichoic acid export membrane protein
MKKLSNTEVVFIKNLFFTVILRGLIGFLNYLFNVFIARSVTENIFNVFSASVGIIYLLQIPFLALQNIIIKKVGESKNLDIKNFKVKNFALLTIVGMLFSTIFYFSRGLISDIANVPIETTLPLMFVLFFSFIAPLPISVLLGKEKIGLVNVILLCEAIMKFILGGIAIRLNGNMDLLILANAVPSVVSALIILPLLKQNPKTDKKVSIQINYKELLLMVFSFLLLSFPYTLDLVLVNPEFRAEYSALTLIGKVVYFACITIASVMFARLVNQNKKKDETKTLIFSLGLTLLMGLGVSLVIWIFKEIIPNIVFYGKYTGISSFLVLYSVFMTFYAFVYMVVNYLMAQGKYWFIISLIITTIIQIFLFTNYNTDLSLVIRNQGIVYLTLLVLVSGNLGMYLMKKKD